MLAEEIELVQRSLEQDTKAFGELITRYQQEMVGLILRMGIQGEDVQDLVQEVFLQAYRSLSSFRQEAKFSTWLYRIASNKCLDFLRKQKRERARSGWGKRGFVPKPPDWYRGYQKPSR